MLKKNHTHHLTISPSRDFVTRASVVFMVIVATSLIVMSHTGSNTSSRFRSGIVDILAPVVALANAPIDTIASMGNWVKEIANLRAENIKLKNANLQLLKWQDMAKDVQAENENLRSLMSVIPDKKSNYITARIVSDFGGAYVRSALISGGANQGIKKDQPVINERGLVGRVIEVGDNSSRALLLSDINSRVPVISEDSREKTILAGNNNSLPSLSYLSPNSAIKVGERILTSGDGGIFPRGIAVGVVESVDSGVVRVHPFVDSVSGEYVSIVDYKF